jgi:hypothetical protein
MGDNPEIDDAAFIHVGNTYGAELARIAVKYFEGDWGVRQIVSYNPITADCTETLDGVPGDKLDAVGLIGYPGTAGRTVRQWIERDYFGRPAFSEGLNSPTLLDSFSAGNLEGYTSPCLSSREPRVRTGSGTPSGASSHSTSPTPKT